MTVPDDVWAGITAELNTIDTTNLYPPARRPPPPADPWSLVHDRFDDLARQLLWMRFVLALILIGLLVLTATMIAAVPR